MPTARNHRTGKQRITQAAAKFTSNDVIATIAAFGNAVNHYAEVVAATGYVWDMSEYNSNTSAGKGSAPAAPPKATGPGPGRPPTVPDPTGKNDDGLATELPGLLAALTAQVPNGDTDKLDHAASSWEHFASDKVITDGQDRLKQIEATFENTKTPEIDNIRAHFTTLGKAVAAISDAATAMGKGVRAHHDDLAALRNQLRSDAASMLTGLIKSADVQPVGVVLADDGIVPTDATTEQGKQKITQAAAQFSSDIANSRLRISLAKPAFGPIDTSGIRKTLTDISALTDPVPDPGPSKPPAPPPSTANTVTAAQLQQIMPGADPAKVAEYLPDINAAMAESGITTPREKAAFLAEISQESSQLNHMSELYDGDPNQYFKQYDNRPDLGNTQPGDGARYRGRGAIQITGKNHYIEAGKALGVDLVDHPELAAEPQYAFRTAAWFWKTQDLNAPADAGNIDQVSRIVNGGDHGLQARRDYYARACKALGC